jgi:hypothetical protein
MIEKIGILLKNWSLVDCNCNTYAVGITFLIIWGIITILNLLFIYDPDGDLGYFDYWSGRKYFVILNKITLFIVNQIYFISIFLFLNLLGIVGLVIGTIVYCLLHISIVNGNNDCSLFGISRSISDFISQINYHYYLKNEYRDGYKNVKDYYKNFMKVESIKIK